MLTYELAPDAQSITCRICGKTSVHPMDVSARYCGHCRVFHDDVGDLDDLSELTEETAAPTEYEKKT